jgi:hypothetical protein
MEESMTEVREVREVPVPVRRRSHSGAVAFFMFLLGAVMIALVVAVLLDVHGTISWPAGRVDIGLNPITTAADTR